VLMEDFLDAARKAGRLELVSSPCGQVAGMLRGRKPAARIVQEMAEGARDAIRATAAWLD
jgi:NAD(P)H-dependent flavin oxidoreductase YrpB (nitropropane dioxygenase family)